MDESEQILKTIAALEAQRTVLGDEVVGMALAPLKEKLTHLQNQVTGERKLVTVLFADLVGFTSMSEHMDPEDVREVLAVYFSRWAQAIEQYGGEIEKYIGDAVMAVFGLKAVHENDAESAILAALQMQSELEAMNAEFARNWSVQLAQRVGIHTGPVVVSRLGGQKGQDFVVVGDTVNTASRLEQAAPAGSILISQETYRHVRGVFTVHEQAPIEVKGKSEPLQTYLVQAVKPRPFRLGAKGIEGIETRTIGREAELKLLQDAYAAAKSSCEPQLITVVADAGVGKSRLLFEFASWLEVISDQIWYFQGRGNQFMSHAPYALARDVMAHRFEIQDSDPASIAREKLVNGFVRLMGPEGSTKAHLAGHLIGLDFSSSPHLRGILSDAKQIRDRAFQYMVEMFQALSAWDGTGPFPVVIMLEDVHWVDDASLDLVETLVRESRGVPLLILCLARPALFERRPHWGKDLPNQLRIDLPLLSAADSSRLVDEIFQKIDPVPPVLKEFVLHSAEGNPFYMEEMVRMLMDKGVILPGPGLWRLAIEKLGEVSVPPTMTGLLQARIDSLPAEEKVVLQRAAVVGRVFWEGAVAYLGDGEPAGPVLQKLNQRELIVKRETSAFSGIDEYIFKHNVLREVTHESVLRRLRRDYHRKVAEWLIQQSGERAGEFSGLIAEHFGQAGEVDAAIHYLRQAAERALQTSAFLDAIDLLDRALALLPEDHTDQAALLGLISEAYWRAGHYGEAAERLEKGLALAKVTGDKPTQCQVQMIMGQMAYEQGKFEPAQAHFEASLALARETADLLYACRALYHLGFLANQQRDLEKGEAYAREALAVAQEANDRHSIALALNGVGIAAQFQGDYEKAIEYLQASLAVAREIDDRRRIASAQGNLGYVEMMRQNYPAARDYLEEALLLLKSVSSSFAINIMEVNLGHVYHGLGDRKRAKETFRSSIHHSWQMKAAYNLLEAIAALAEIAAEEGQPEKAAEWLGWVLRYPLMQGDTKKIVERIRKRIETLLAPEVYQAGLERGREFEPEAVVQQILQEA